MKLTEYYKICLDKLEKGDYRIGVNSKKPEKSDIKTNELPLHALNYILYEYLIDNKDKRWKLLFEYVIVPNGVNRKGCDIDFTKVDFDDFLEFMINAKT